jgi:hypothetical protein
MSRLSISGIYKNQSKAFQKDLKKAVALDDEIIHRLRVDIKNLKVLLELLRVLSKKKFSDKPVQKLLAPVFDHAGEIRTAGLNAKLTEPFKTLPLHKFRKSLARRRQRFGMKLREEIQEFRLKKFERLNKKAMESFRKIKKQTLSKNSAEYLRILFAEIRADIFDISDDDTLHEIRKKLKTIKSIGAILDQLRAEHPFVDELKKVSLTYEKIGQWHDLQVLIAELEQFVNEMEDPRALETTTPLLLRLKKKSLSNKRRIEKRLKADLVM